MARRGETDRGELSFGSEHVVARLPHGTRSVVAKILHRANDATGAATHLVLDRYIHHEGCDTIDEWRVSGAVTTELRRE